MSNTLVGLLTLRLTSLGWVLERLLRLFFSLVFSLERLSFAFFAVFPLEGWQPVDIFIHALPSVFSG